MDTTPPETRPAAPGPPPPLAARLRADVVAIVGSDAFGLRRPDWLDRPRFGAVVRLALAVLVVVTVVRVWTVDAPVHLDWFPLHPGLVAAAVSVLVAAVYASRARGADAAGAAVMLVALATFIPVLGSGPTLGLLAAAAMEEGVFRLAAPLVIGGALLRAGTSVVTARTVALVASGVAFVLLPGHLAQLDAGLTDPAVAGFVSFHLLFTWMVWRCGLVLTASVGHALLNATLFTVATTPAAARPAAILALMSLAMIVHRGLHGPLKLRPGTV